jgi:hypothetical protein
MLGNIATTLILTTYPPASLPGVNEKLFVGVLFLNLQLKRDPLDLDGLVVP